MRGPSPPVLSAPTFAFIQHGNPKETEVKNTVTRPQQQPLARWRSVASRLRSESIGFLAEASRVVWLFGSWGLLI